MPFAVGAFSAIGDTQAALTMTAKIAVNRGSMPMRAPVLVDVERMTPPEHVKDKAKVTVS